MSKLLYGVAYYDEYISEERLDKDIEMMKKANINVVRIAESTWSTLEPEEGVFNFHHIDRVLDAMHDAGIGVIIGTPTYAIPHWLAKKFPDILVTTPDGQETYGHRQIMDIMNPDFLHHAKIVINSLLKHIHLHPAIIGYQVDNETKHYNNVGKYIKSAFKNYLQEKFQDLDELNNTFGLNYWSNRICSWDDIPPIEGTINASLGNEFARFRREVVKDYLDWQVALVKNYSNSHQFVTQNFDLEWRGYSFGLQPAVDHFAAAEKMDVTGIDIYHPSQDKLTGREISFGGDMARSTKKGENYLVLETQAQGFAKWTPFPGQLRLQAFSHIASGAKMVAYWHWHSIHNSYETYWKGLLSHDFSENSTYLESTQIGKEFSELSHQLESLRVDNDVAIYVSNDSLEALSWFPPDEPQLNIKEKRNYIYNDILRTFYDSLYDQNISVDFINHLDSNDCKYKVLIIPALYAISTEQLEQINKFVHQGGRIIVGFKSGFCDENIQVRSTTQPAILSQSCQVSYSQFVIPTENTQLESTTSDIKCCDESPKLWMELLTSLSADNEILLKYKHKYWDKYAAATLSKFGSGQALYLGCLPSKELFYQLFTYLVKGLPLRSNQSSSEFPIIVKSLINKNGNNIQFVFNYSNNTVKFHVDSKKKDVITSSYYDSGSQLLIQPWDLKILTD
ncbi:beta-galactosidase [Celerinatantimonas sp. MCCC 1A17872]|uniref:beta-galactosidase n=1 Tax=Celerinatantimonas sp. MCCC 1A17872 TaxID=3177514 RepID=UPI0038BFEC17